MAKIILFNKPFQVLTQFTDRQSDRSTLADYIKISNVYPAGRLDYDSEGLLLLTDDGQLASQITHPRHKQPKTYWVQVEGTIEESTLIKLRKGVDLKDGLTKPAKVKVIPEPQIWPRNPSIRDRQSIPTQWLELTITEGKNRQVRRMTAAVGHPTLRLIRMAIGPWKLEELQPGEWRETSVHTPSRPKPKRQSSNKQNPGGTKKPGNHRASKQSTKRR